MVRAAPAETVARTAKAALAETEVLAETVAPAVLAADSLLRNPTTQSMMSPPTPPNPAKPTLPPEPMKMRFM